MPRTRQRTPALRQRIVDAAVDAASRAPLDHLTTRAVAALAGTSAPAVHELCGGKAGLIREVFIEGFRRLAGDLRTLTATADPLVDLREGLLAVGDFARREPRLFELMFSCPVREFRPTPEDWLAALDIQAFFVGNVERALAAGAIDGDVVDIAQVLVSVAHGLATREASGLLGRSLETIQRRWHLAIDACLRGFAA